MKKIKTVAIAGSLCRIGTTTQAIQLVKYLKLMGHQTAYVEMNRTEYVEVLLNLFCDAKKMQHHVLFHDVALYKGKDITIAYREEYEYLVKDYGSFTSKDFETISFLEQDIKVVVCGAKPNEIAYIEDVLKNPLFQEAGYIFSFVPKEDRDDIRAMMDDRGNRTFFADYVCDPYVYLSNANRMCKELLHL